VPGVVCNLALGGAALAIGTGSHYALRSDHKALATVLRTGSFFVGLGGLLQAALMLLSSKSGKFRARERLLDSIPWRGDETVLDVGCGRGLMLICAAKRLETGKAVGADIWQKEDQYGNDLKSPVATPRRRVSPAGSR
jgi:ribosomal protein L11 methylase PrmA